MSYCDHAGCAITFTFTEPVPGAKVVFDPPQAGTQTWATPNTLVFTPGPKSLTWGSGVWAKIPEADFLARVQVPFFWAAGKVAEWPVIVGQPRVVAILSNHLYQIGRGALFVLYDQPVDPAKIGAQAKLSARGHALAVRVARPASGAQILDEPLPLENIVTVTAGRLPSDGDLVTLELPSRDDTQARPFVAKLMVTTTFTATIGVNGDDEGQPRHARDRVPLNADIGITLTTPVTPGELGRHVHVEPKPRSSNVWVSNGYGTLHAVLDPGVLYKVTVDGELGDIFGNKLGEPVVGRYRADDAPASLEVPRDALVLERGRAKLPVRGTNVGELVVHAERYDDPSEYIAALRSRPGECTGDARPLALDAPLNARGVGEIALEPGMYCVSVTGKGRGSVATGQDLAAVALVQVTNVGVTAKVSADEVFAWVTELSGAKPHGGAAISFTDANGKIVARATTDADGVARLPLGGGAGAAGGYVVVGETADGMVLPLVDAQLSRARQFGMDGAVRAGDPLAASLFTERGVYRPGETVHLEALVREPGTHVPSAGALEVTIKDPRGEQVAKENLPLDMFGAGTMELALKDGARVGEYQVRAALRGREIVRGFRVEEYRVPTFQVNVAAADGEWQVGQTARATVAASYLHGGALGGREVKWEITRRPEAFESGGFGGFVFGTAAGAGTGAGVGTGDVESLAHGAGKLDGEGKLALKLVPDHTALAGPMRYSIEASVTDVDRQVYAGRLSRVVHAASLYVGMQPPVRSVIGAGDPLHVPIAAVSVDGAPRAGVQVTATLERIEYQGVTRLDTRPGTGEPSGESQRLNRAVATVVSRCTVTTARAAVACDFRVADAGEYRVRAVAEDDRHRPVEASFAVSASGGNTVAWPRFDHERIQIVADKASYAPGETARLVIQSPFAHARGMLTLEQGGVLEHRLFVIDGDTPELRVPITAAQAPNLFASVVLLRGRVHDQKDATGFETGAPAFRIGYAELRVEPRAERLSVAVETAKKAYPGSDATIDLTVRDSDGKPRGGQATVMVVDEAVLGMTHYRTPDPLADLFAPRPLGVRTGESRLDLLDSRRSRREEVFPGGDGGEYVPGSEDGNDDDDARGHKKKANDEPPADLRKLFRSTAFFDARVPVDASGHARVTFKLPDNVTTYRVMAVAVDAGTHAGSGQSGVLVRKPLIVQPALPRFVHPGDQLRLEAIAFNGTDDGGKVELEASVQNVNLNSVSGTSAQIVKAGGETTFAFPATISDDARGEATIRFTARLGAFTDAVEVKLPILDPGSARTIVVSRLVASDGVLDLPLPADRRPGSAKVEILASSTPLSQLKDAVGYLMTYPNGCIEQTTSTAYPLVMLHDLLPEIGITVDEKQLRAYAEAGVKRILSFQTTSGGLSYWPGSDKPHAFATAFGLTALIEAKKQGYDVPDAALARMADFLETALRTGQITGEMPHMGMADADTRAFFVMTLGRLGRPQPGYVTTLWQARDKLTPFGMAFLAVAVLEGNSNKELLEPILKAVRAADTEDSKQAWYDKAAKSDWAFDSPLRTHASALLAYAGSGSDPDASAKLLTGLLGRQRNGLWGNTQENVFGIMAVARLVGAKSSGAAPEFAVKIDGRPLDASRIHEVSPRVKRIELDDRELGWAAGDTVHVQLATGGAPIFTTIRLEYIAKLDEKNRAPRAAGFDITRRYETLGGAVLDGKKIPLGSLVRVRLHVKAAAANHYVAISDALPAGLEPLNAALDTSEVVAANATPSADARRALAALSYSELRDARAAFYIDDMAAGDYELVYLARATTPGTFIRPAAHAEAMYAPDVAGSSAIDVVTVE